MVGLFYGSLIAKLEQEFESLTTRLGHHSSHCATEQHGIPAPLVTVHTISSLAAGLWTVRCSVTKRCTVIPQTIEKLSVRCWCSSIRVAKQRRRRVEKHLGEAVDLVHVGVEAVGHRNVDQPVVASEGHSWFSPLLGERVEPCASTTTQNDTKHRLLNSWKGLGEVLQTVFEMRTTLARGGNLGDGLPCYRLLW